MALLPDSQPAVSGRLASYALTAASDAPERDPADWVLEGLPVAGALEGDGALQQQQVAANGQGQQPAVAVKGAAAAAPAAGGGRGALQGWRVLDAREGLLFGSRGDRQQFQVCCSL